MSGWLAPLAALPAAAATNWCLRRLERRLPILLARPSIRRPLTLLLLPLKLGVWVAAALFVTERIMALHAVRDMLARALDVSLRAPLFRHVLDEHGFEDGSFFYRFADEAPGAVARGRPAGGASTATG